MRVNFNEIQVKSRQKYDLIDITREVEDFVNKSGIKNGLCLVYAPHSTLAIVVNEAENGLMRDIISKIKAEYPPGAGWNHDKIDDNADAHLASAFIGSSKVFPVKDGKLIRGTWQNILAVESDGPRARRVVVEIMGELQKCQDVREGVQLAYSTRSTKRIKGQLKV